MENERDQQDVLMALQGMGRMSLMMDPVFKLTATGTILLIQHFARMHKEGLLNRREFQNFQEFAKLTEGNCKCAGGKLERTGKKWISLTDGRTECPLHSDAGSE